MKRLKQIVFCALLAALSMILTRFLGLNLSQTLRISFGNTPIFLAGIWFGPLAGMVVGAVADIVGATVLSGYGFNPLLTIPPVLIGLLSGTFGLIPSVKRGNIVWSYFVVLVTYLLASIMIGTSLMTIEFGGTFASRVATRVPIYAITGVVEAFAISFINKSKAVNRISEWK